VIRRWLAAAEQVGTPVADDHKFRLRLAKAEELAG